MRSEYVRTVILPRPGRRPGAAAAELAAIPRTLIRYWHDPGALPDDVRACLDSWEPLRDEGFGFRMFDDGSAAAYVAERYGERECEAFARCRHPAMRSDYFRLCFLLAEGGLHVDADDVWLDGPWPTLFQDGRLKVQPMCYDVLARGMVPAAEIRRAGHAPDGRVFYVNNNPIAAPAGHPVLRLALARATGKLLEADRPEIQSTTGPGNLTAALVAHAWDLELAGANMDFELLFDWGAIAETRWDLSYRHDARNWRNMGDA